MKDFPSASWNSGVPPYSSTANSVTSKVESVKWTRSWRKVSCSPIPCIFTKPEIFRRKHSFPRHYERRLVDGFCSLAGGREYGLLSTCLPHTPLYNTTTHRSRQIFSKQRGVTPDTSSS